MTFKKAPRGPAGRTLPKILHSGGDRALLPSGERSNSVPLFPTVTNSLTNNRAA